MAAKMTVSQYVAGLRSLADILERSPKDNAVVGQRLFLGAWNKEELLTALRFYGGIWDKSLSYGSEDMYLDSRTLPIRISIARDKVCRKTVTYDCEPMFSPEDEKEVDAALVAHA